MTFSWLLAKKAVDSDNPEPEQTLVGHTTAVLNAMRILQEMFMADVMALMPGVSSDCWQTALFCSAWLHDLGKANDHFQKMLRIADFRQGVRHETLGLIVLSELLDPWLANLWSNYPPFLKAAIFFAVGGHHLKFPDKEQRGHSAVVFLGGHPQLHKLLEIGRKRFGLAPPPRLANRSFSLLALDGIGRHLSKLRRQLDLEFSSKEKLFIAAVKATLMAADLAGSALPPRGIELESWLRKRLQVILEKDQLEKIVQQKLQDKHLRPFQRQVQESASATLLVEAGCGSGKTAAAYLWASQRAAGKRLFYCYPTTGTASEGFSGYLREPDFEALLIHSRATIDYRLLENMPPHSKSDLELRSMQLEALDTWPIPAVVCTAHTVLGLLQNVRRAILAWPSLVRAVFVFDEIHSFSPLLFQHLLRFLDVFHKVPVLLMTATLPPERKEALERVCRDRGGLTVIRGPKNREEAKRYRLQRSPEHEVWNYVEQTLAKGWKVLWVANTVDRAINLARQALERGLPVQPFHSRYRYKDRLVRQRHVIDGFSPERGALLAVTTQVAEMSLDISADLLVTEYAPVASLIQRLGRLNRFVEVPEAVKPAFFLKPENALPYAKKDEEAKFWGEVEKWLDQVATGLPQSQRDLAAAFIEVEGTDGQLFKDKIFCDWLDDPWSSLSNRHPLMEPGYTIEVVREEDAAEGLLPEMAMPMPFPHGNSWRSWQQRGRYFIAPLGAIDYDPFGGGRYAHEKPHFEII